MTLQIKLSRPPKKIIENKASNFTYLVIDIIKKEKKNPQHIKEEIVHKLQIISYFSIIFSNNSEI